MEDLYFLLQKCLPLTFSQSNVTRITSFYVFGVLVILRLAIRVPSVPRIMQIIVCVVRVDIGIVARKV